jgi:hypothetical protein
MSEIILLVALDNSKKLESTFGGEGFKIKICLVILALFVKKVKSSYCVLNF